MTALLLALLAALPAQEAARVPGLYLQGDSARPQGRVVEPEIEQLLGLLAGSRIDNDVRMPLLAQLAYRADGPLPYEQIRRIKRHVRGDAMVDYLRCMALCGEQGLEELRNYEKRRKPELRAEVVYGLGRYASDGEAYARAVLADHREPLLAQVAALRALADRASDFASVEALRRISIAEGPLLLEALAVLRRAPSDDHVLALIDLLKRDDGRPSREAMAMLQRITGYSIGSDYRSWMRFYLRHHVEGTPFRAPEEGERNSAPTLSYMGLPLYGNQIVFVLDSSGSMREPLPEQPRSTKGQRAVAEFVGLLPRLPREAAFNVVFFSGQVIAWSDELESQGEGTVQSAREWVRARDFDGGTNIYGGLEFAFLDPAVEEIVLLSDGAPTAGALTDPAEILARVARWNRWRHVRISTVSFGAPPKARAFLYRLSRENGGACRVID
jgi:hypothetical protein